MSMRMSIGHAGRNLGIKGVTPLDVSRPPAHPPAAGGVIRCQATDSRKSKGATRPATTGAGWGRPLLPGRRSDKMTCPGACRARRAYRKRRAELERLRALAAGLAN